MTYNPVDEINRYNAITKERGYPFFAEESSSEYYTRHDTKSMEEINQEANNLADQFLNAARNSSADNHFHIRKRYRHQFEGNEEKVRDHFRQEVYMRHGVGRLPWRNKAYEQKILTPKGKLKTPDERAEYATFKALMRAKWEAVGYHGDSKIIKAFRDKYALALQL